MANQEHARRLQQGVKTWNEWRTKPRQLEPETLKEKEPAEILAHLFSQSSPDLTGADLSGLNLEDADLNSARLASANLAGANLRGANLSCTTLQFANLTRAYLGHVDLDSADLTGATLVGVNLTYASLRNCRLHSVDLTGALLTDAVLSGAEFKDANLTDARLGWTIFGNTSLAGVKWLDSCKHYFPSCLDYHTLAKSWPLPLKFLRGCGLSDEYIQYLSARFNQPIEFYSCFISYSTADEGFVTRLHDDLQNNGVRCWYAPHNIQSGKKIDEQIDEAIRVYDRLLLILSEASMKSEWVKTEIAHARQKEIILNRRVLFPIRLVGFSTIREWKCFDADAGKDSAQEIREFFIPDFSNWKDYESYEKSFKRLLKDLKQ